MVTLYLNGTLPWLKVFGDDQKPRVVLVTVLTSLILLLYDGLMVGCLIGKLPLVCAAHLSNTDTRKDVLLEQHE